MASRALTVGAAIVIAALGVAAEASTQNGFAALTVLDWLVGTSYLAVAVVIATNDRGTALVALLVAVAWFAGTLADGDGWLARLGTAAVLTYRAPLLHLLATPVRGRLVTIALAVAYLGVLAPASVAAPVTAGVGAIVGVVGLNAGTHAAADRRAVVFGRAVLALLLSVLWAIDEWLPVPAGTGAVLLDLLLLGGAGLVVVGRGSAWAAAPGLLVDLGPSRTASSPVASVIARALDAPGLEIRYRPPDGVWRDELGAEAVPPPAGAVFAAGPDGGEVALVGCPPDTAASELAQVAAASAALALADTQALTELRQRSHAIEASRRRLLEVSDSERQAIGNRVRAGPIARLLHTRDMFAGRADSELAPLVADLNTAISELRDLADGLYPDAVMTGSMSETLADIAGRFEPAAEVVINIDRRLPPAHHVLVSFVCAECLTNAARYAAGAPTRITVELENGQLRVEVIDYGSGGARLRDGGGLRGLADRIEILGGQLIVSSPADGPTRVAASVPVPAHWQ
jgi:signal transduction histidine kinase